MNGKIQDLEKLLAPDERERADRFTIASARTRFIGSRAALRLLLAQELRIDPGEIAFNYSPAGKPFLAKPSSVGRHFNVAHSGDLALVGLAPDEEVGVDLELIRPQIEVGEIAARFFADAENELIQRAGPANRLRLFYQIWTRKEAVLKACGLGITSGLRLPDVSPGLDQTPPAELIGIELSGQRWLLRDLNPAAGYQGALAMASPAT